jgi:uncharacterized protein (UPF0276 family)
MTIDTPLIGIGYRAPIHDWTVEHLERFDVLEVVVDHYLTGGPTFRNGLASLLGKVPVTAHGIGLSLGSTEPLDYDYIEEIAEITSLIGATNFSEHVAFTRSSGIELANLLPLPKTRETLDFLVGRLKEVCRIMPVPVSLENITYLFDYNYGELSDAEFLIRLCERTETTLLLDLQNLYTNALNHRFDPVDFLEALPRGIVKAVHMAGGQEMEHVEIDSHSYPVREEVLALLGLMRKSQSPDTIILERDGRLDKPDEMLDDIDNIRDQYDLAPTGKSRVQPVAS